MLAQETTKSFTVLQDQINWLTAQNCLSEEMLGQEPKCKPHTNDQIIHED